MIKMFSFRDENGVVVAEVPIVVYNGEKMHQMIMTLLPGIIGQALPVVIQSLMAAADTERGDGPHQVPPNVNYTGIALTLQAQYQPETDEPMELQNETEVNDSDDSWPYDKMN